MQMHTIPQNVSAYQDKVVGALIGRQFVYIAVGAILAFLIFSSQIGPVFFRITLVVPIVLFSIAMALLRINEIPFDQLVFSYSKSLFGPTEWTWGREKVVPAQLEVLFEPDFTPDSNQSTKSIDPAKVKQRRAQHMRTIMETRQQTAMDEDEIAYIEQLDFSVSLPQTVIQATDSNQPAPPMLTPENFQKQLHQVKKNAPAKVTFTSGNPTIALAGASSGRRQYIAADNHLALTKEQPQANRSLSKPLAVVNKLPIRGEKSLPISDQSQQNLQQIVAYAAQTNTPTQTISTSMSSNTQAQNDINNPQPMSTDNQDHQNPIPASSPIDGTPDSQPTQGYEAPFGQNKPQQPSSQPQHQPSQPQTPHNQESLGQTLANLQQQVDQIDNSTLTSGTSSNIAKFDKFSSQSAPTVDINLNSTISPTAQEFNLSASDSQFAPLPVSPVLPAQTSTPDTPQPPSSTAPEPAPQNQAPNPGNQTSPSIDSDAIKVIDRPAQTLATKQINLTNEPNIINGRVLDNQGQSVSGVIIVVKDDQGESKRALKTNKLGQFIVTTPLSNGTYTVEVDKKGFSFDVIQVELTGKILPAIEIHAK